MDKFKLNTLHYVLIGTIVGMVAVFGAFSLYKQKMTAKDVPEIHTAESKPSEAEEKCPVCGKPVNTASDFYITLAGKQFNFCGTICLKSFKDNPFPYLKNMGVNLDVNIIPEGSEGKNYQEVPYDKDSQENNNEPDSDTQTPDSPIQAPEEKAPAPPATSSSEVDTEEIPLPDDITSAPSKQSNDGTIEDLMLDGGKSEKASAPVNKGGIEEIPLNSDAPAKSKPAPASVQKTDNMEIEEIPLN